jgi:hypothetical protein
MTIEAVSGGCRGRVFLCRCSLAEGHHDAHVCLCGSSWRGTEGRDDFEIINFPEVGPWLSDPPVDDLDVVGG